MRQRFGLWTATEFAIFNAGIAVVVVGVLLMSGSVVPAVLGLILVVVGLAAWVVAATRMLQRTRRERAQAGR